MGTYVYWYKADSSCEPIGRVMATSLDEAREMIKVRKQLSEQAIADLFEIKQVSDYENSVR